jgi:hypothetical protein
MWHTSKHDSTYHVCTISGRSEAANCRNTALHEVRSCAEAAASRRRTATCATLAAWPAGTWGPGDAFLAGMRELLNAGLVFQGLRTDGDAPTHCALAEDADLGWVTDSIQDQNLCVPTC